MRTPHNDPLGSDIPEGRADRQGSARPSQRGSSSAEPERKCILSGEHGARDDLVRLAISPPQEDGRCVVLPDALARAPGRGAWLGVNRAALETAMANGKLKGALARAYKGEPLSIPADLGARIEAALIRAVLDRLGLEQRSGKLLTGSDRIAEKARAGQVAWLAHAADAGEDGSRKLAQAWRVGEDAEGSGRSGITLPLDRATLSVALGRDNVVHLALTDPAAASRVAVPLARLMRFLGPDPTLADPSLAGRDTRRDDTIDLKDELAK